MSPPRLELAESGSTICIPSRLNSPAINSLGPLPSLPKEHYFLPLSPRVDPSTHSEISLFVPVKRLRAALSDAFLVSALVLFRAYPLIGPTLLSHLVGEEVQKQSTLKAECRHVVQRAT